MSYIDTRAVNNTNSPDKYTQLKNTTNYSYDNSNT